MKKTSERKYIKIRGANEHNLKNIDVDIPRDEFVVLTGLSGSGKSSLAFDTIYAEGQRRYMESLSSYARQFLGQMEKPNVEKIEGLSPAISIDQKSTNRNPRSTVGTVTEIYDYFRLLYARIGVPHCPKCGKEIKKQTVDQMVDQIMGLPERTKIQLLAPVVRGRKGEHQKLFEQAKRSGYVRVIVDGSMYELSEEIKLAFVFAQFRFRFQGYFNGQFHIFAFFEGRFFNFRIGYRDQFFLVQSFAVCFVSNNFKSFLFYSFFAIVHFDDSTRSFAFTEARDICLVSNFLYSLFIACVYLSSRSGNF